MDDDAELLSALIGLENDAKVSTKTDSKKRKIQQLDEDIFFAAQPTTSDDPSSLSELRESLRLSDDDEDEADGLSSAGKEMKRILKSRQNANSGGYVLAPPVKKASPAAATAGGTRASGIVVEEKSGLRITDCLLPPDVLRTKMADRRLIRLSTIHRLASQCLEGDWITMGVIATKSETKTSAKGTAYSLWRLTDLSDMDRLVTLFLFGEAHQQLWKTSEYNVVGILNPDIMDKNDKNSDLCLSVNQSLKILLIGTSADLGRCKSKKKNGDLCNSFINKTYGEFCNYHVQSAYRQMSSSRMDLQSSYSGHAPKKFSEQFRKSLNGVFYGGQMFSEPESAQPAKRRKSTVGPGDVKTLEALGVMPQQAALDLTPIHATFTKRLAEPTPGARNLSQAKESTKKEDKAKMERKPTIDAIDLMKDLKSKYVNASQGKSPSVMSTGRCLNPFLSIPQLGRGLRPQDGFSFDVSPSQKKKKKATQAHVAKLQAIEKLKEKNIEKNDPNDVFRRKEKQNSSKKENFLNKVETNIQKSQKAEAAAAAGSSSQSITGGIDVRSQEFQKILNAKSVFETELNLVEVEKEEQYFKKLEMKETLELKMSTIMEKKRSVVSCSQCNYTTYKQGDLCKSQGHRVKVHEATQRFYECVTCKERTTTLHKYPKHPCRKCGSSSFQRAAMWKERKGPILPSEQLLLRGEEVKYLSSMATYQKEAL